MTTMETTQTTFEEKLEDTFTRWLLENRLHEEGEVTEPLADDFDARLKAAFSSEEMQANERKVKDLVEGLPLYVQLERVDTAFLREETERTIAEDKARALTFYQIPKNEELRAKIAALGLAEEDGRRILRANARQREKLFGQYFEEKVDALVATYQRSTNTEDATDVIFDKIDALVEVLGNKYEQIATIAKHRVYEIAEDKEVVEYKPKPAPKARIATRLRQGEEKIRQSLERYVPNLYAELQIPEILRKSTPLSRYEIREPVYFKEPQTGFRTEDPVPTIGLLEYLASRPIEKEEQEAPARSRFLQPSTGIEVDEATIDRYLARQAAGEKELVDIKEEDLTYISTAPKAKKVNPAQKFVDKIRARRAAKEAAIAREAETSYERPTTVGLYTPVLTKLALGMSPSMYETTQPEEQKTEAYSIIVSVPEVPAIVMPEPTVIREAREASLANVYRVLDEVKANARKKQEARAREVAAFDEVSADFFNNYNPETAEVATTPVVIERGESNEVLENRVLRANRFSKIKGAITAVATVTAAVAAFVGGLGYFAKLSNDAVNAVYESLSPKTSIVETRVEEYQETSKGEETKAAYAPQKNEAGIKNTVEPKAVPQVYAPVYGTEKNNTDNLGVKGSSQKYEDARVQLHAPDTSYTPVLTANVPIKIERTGTQESGLSSETTREIVHLYEAQQTARAQERVEINPWTIAETQAKINTFKERRENWASAQALLKQYDAILANPNAYQVE